MKLTAKTVQAAKYTDKDWKLFDGRGLYLHIKRTSRVWRYTYRIAKKPREYTIGSADIYTLAEARKKHLAARLLVAEGKDPVAVRNEERAKCAKEVEEKIKRRETADALIESWLRVKDKDWAESNSSKIKSRLNVHIPDWFRNKPVVDITSKDVVKVLKEAETTSIDIVHRIRGYLRHCFDLAVANELITVNPVLHPMVNQTVPKRKKNKAYAHIKQAHEIGKVLVKIDKHVGNPSVTTALRLLPYVFTRPGELSGMRWREIEWSGFLWRIPAERMKGRIEHLVPLSDQVIAILKSHRDTPGIKISNKPEHDFVFPGRDGTKPFSNMALSKAFKDLGIPSTTLVPHGWRHTASSALNERSFEINGEIKRFSADAIEQQLAHTVKGVRGIYNSSEYIAERRELLQAWANWLDLLRVKVDNR